MQHARRRARLVKPLTLSDAAQLLNLSPATLRSQIRNGALHGTRVGRDWTVTPKEIERYRQVSLGKRGRPAKEKA